MRKAERLFTSARFLHQIHSAGAPFPGGDTAASAPQGAQWGSCSCVPCQRPMEAYTAGATP